ncbi:MAG: 2-amino-4-hydroxy-6-hydroxymethyldihydropteridine diphosphokinase [Bacteroidetes bacterium]|nr:2-amino-4-hydroxy-6-hydroxymethyldihydropteridine diphosphokinase [Bacteroidota bacterium]
MKKIFLLLGSNIEPREEYLNKAERKIIESVGTIIQRSKIYESEPTGFNSDQNFLNRTLIISSLLSVGDILNEVHIIEKELGRKRPTGGYTSRTIDIDILYFNSEIIKTNILTVPHPRLHERNFTLIPLAEIAPDFIHPILKLDSKKLLEICQDSSEVAVFKMPNY